MDGMEIGWGNVTQWIPSISNLTMGRHMLVEFHQVVNQICYPEAEDDVDVF